ncbi:hypothetical protein DBR00_06980 [Pseudomonas sp. HMWF032]|uniref:hypothetical protein n=1 Tax=Pseudomonas sp. HMWF032 TaxID=2056866 RepID=UPI000D38DAF0|nr:hypothetical protein [Pseudomonas sp. HMWF032]PTS85513.1 hypothetical protein DBR00_06980 [Pseudomonas sp. HMWF032]PTT82268.1 hypothetical protein DBR41_14400 [Pseudomonas sp. HMWF010]
MSRTASKGVALVEDAPLNTEVLLAQHNQVAVLNEEQETRVRAVAEQLGYQLPAECTDPDLIQRDIAANMRRSVEACLEVGRGLQVLKAATQHGNFIDRLDVLGLDRKVAVKFMASAAKFASLGGSSALTKALGNQSKLFEMLVLDDEEIQELELTGQTGELTLDDVATMSVKELRKALRETRQDKEAQGRVLADKNARIDELATRLAKQPLIQVPTPDEAAKKLRQEVIGIAFEAEADISGKLRGAFATMAAHTEETGTDHRNFKAGLVHQLERLLADIRAEFQLPDSTADDDLSFFTQKDT